MHEFRLYNTHLSSPTMLDPPTIADYILPDGSVVQAAPPVPVYTYDTDLVRVGRNELGTNVGDWKGAMDHDGAIYFRFTPILTRNQPAHYGVIATIYFSDNSGAWSLPQMQIGTVPGSSGGLYFWRKRRHGQEGGVGHGGDGSRFEHRRHGV